MTLLTIALTTHLITFFTCFSFLAPVTAISKQNHRLQHPNIERQILQEVELIQSGQIANNDLYAAERLRSDLLEHYDAGTYPWNYVWDLSTNNSSSIRKGVRVGVDINLHKVLDVNVKESKLDLLIWFRLEWNDPRLAWNPDDYGGLKNIWFFIGDPEFLEIWSPDFVLWNHDVQLLESLSSTQALVYPNGTVYWSRPGHLQPSCRLSGLTEFPFDKLQCTMEFGSWTHSGLYIRPYPMGGGANIGGSVTSGESFNEYTLRNFTVEDIMYDPFPIAPGEDWPALLYNITFTRNWQPYARGYLLIQIILNFVAFMVFWLPPDSGERMGLAITALLAGVASELVVAADLPITKEWTWMSKFSLGSLVFAALPIVETTIVIYLHEFTGDTFVHFQVFEYLTRRITRRGSLRHSTERETEIVMTETEKQRNVYWRRLGLYIDEVSRIVFPIVYGIWVLVFLLVQTKAPNPKN